MSESKTPTPYRRAAIAGRTFGIYLCLIFISMVLSQASVIASVAFPLLTLGMPVMLYRSMLRSHKLRDYESSVGELSVEGLLTVFYGSMICGLLTMVYLRWIDPDYIINIIRDCIAVLRETGSDANIHTAETLNRMITSSAVPSASDFTLSMLWLTMSAGGILSLIFAPIIRAGKPRRRKADRPSSASIS